jgi:HEAT repeat protein
MVITPDKYSAVSTYDLVDAVARGSIGFDHRVLRAILDRGDQAIPDLVRWGTEDHEDLEYDLSDELVAIFRHLQTPAAVPFFIAYLRRDPLDVTDELPDAMYPIREAAVEPLLKLYEELEEEDSGEVAFLLASFRIKDDRILRILSERLEFDVIDGAICLSLYGDPAARSALENMLGEVGPEEVHVRRNIEQAIGELGRPVDDHRTEWSIWDDFPEKSTPEFEALGEDERLEYLTSEDPEYRIGAASSFINATMSERARKALFDRAQTDEDPSVRGKCWEALSDETEEKQIRAAMLSRLKDEAVPLVERQGALIGLASDAGESPIRQYAEQFYTNPEARAAALKAMWNSMDRSFGQFFPKHLEDADRDVKKQAIAGIGYLGVQDSSEKLKKFFEDDDLRPNALFAYALSVRHEISRGRIRSLFRKIEEIAKGLSEEEEQLVQIALDERLLLNGHDPVFFPDRYGDENDAHDHDRAPAPVTAPATPGRNDPCPCGSGKKYKKCCGA